MNNIIKPQSTINGNITSFSVIHNPDISKSHNYTFDDKRVFIVTPVYRDNGANTKEILTKLMCEEVKKINKNIVFDGFRLAETAYLWYNIKNVNHELK